MTPESQNNSISKVINLCQLQSCLLPSLSTYPFLHYSGIREFRASHKQIQILVVIYVHVTYNYNTKLEGCMKLHNLQQQRALKHTTANSSQWVSKTITLCEELQRKPSDADSKHRTWAKAFNWRNNEHSRHVCCVCEQFPPKRGSRLCLW